MAHLVLGDSKINKKITGIMGIKKPGNLSRV